MAARIAWSRSLIFSLRPSMALSHSFCPGHLSLMARIKLLMASVTALVWEARSCHIGGSLGLIARFLAEVSRLLLDRLTFLPAIMMGSWAWRALALILAGVEANWGLEAKVVRASTASTRGLVVSAHAWRLASLRSPARDCSWGGEGGLVRGSLLEQWPH